MRIAAIIILICLAVLAAFFLYRLVVPEKEITVGWREDFDSVSRSGKPVIPKWWRLVKKPNTRPASFSEVINKKEGLSFLHMEADKASAGLVCWTKGVDLKKTPVLRWHWRVTALPKGADGREAAKDDQAIGIYAGTGTMLNKKTVSYRWDTDTPKGSEGKCTYGAGTVKVKWYTLRNKDDGENKWFVEERNFAEDFKKAWGYYPGKVYLSVSCNSQYTGTRAAADLDWIEFTSVSGGAEKK